MVNSPSHGIFSSVVWLTSLHREETIGERVTDTRDKTHHCFHLWVVSYLCCCFLNIETSPTFGLVISLFPSLHTLWTHHKEEESRKSVWKGRKGDTWVVCRRGNSELSPCPCYSPFSFLGFAIFILESHAWKGRRRREQERKRSKLWSFPFQRHD